MLAVYQNSTADQEICLEAVVLPVLENKYPLCSLSVARLRHRRLLVQYDVIIMNGLLVVSVTISINE